VFDEAEVDLGRLLFHDKILSGNRNVSCGTCHLGRFGSSDGLSLGVGEGGAGVGPERNTGTGPDRIVKRVPRNAPALWNLGHPSVRVMFWDGRVEILDTFDNGFDTPAEEFLPEDLKSFLAVQALFPLVSRVEMAGDPGENEVIGAKFDRIDKGWPILVSRLVAIPEYVELFARVYPDVDGAGDITIAHVANALAAYQSTDFQSIDSPFDAFLREGRPLPAAAERGRRLFYGEAGCAECHSGPFLTDQRFHALGLPPFGPGRTRTWDPMPRDVGRLGASDRLEDAYRFRTPSLRNVALTAPYGHNGAWPTLEGIIGQHVDPLAAAARWKPEMANLPDAPWLAARDFVIHDDAREMARQRQAARPVSPPLDEAEIADLVAFLHALTGEKASRGLPEPPESVPSGLPIDR
jgi:cytochrome c peroxidase